MGKQINNNKGILKERNLEMEEIILKTDLKGKLVGYEWDLNEPEYCVCLIHGIGEYAARYNRMAGKFNENGIAVFAMDLKGHGKSYGNRGHCAPRLDIQKDIDTLIEHIKAKHPNCQIILYGHSMGGNIGLDYRYRGKYNSDMSGYIISAPWIYLVKKIPDWQYKFIKLVAKFTPSMAISSKIDERDLGNLKYVKGYNKHPMVHDKVSLLCALEGFEMGNLMAEGKQPIQGDGQTRPMLLMHGNKDIICDVVGSRQIKENEGDICKYIEWDGLYHEIHNGGKKSEGDEVIASAIEFILEL